ncbi:MAG: acetyl-CoA carboxylase biotin carboxyl carrier protein [Alphaproteobacteria bacterium]|nr:acetyl-CoA carboxylase biotin carboxyl carrier protein [Alphaproteobacteria bacterium]
MPAKKKPVAKKAAAHVEKAKPESGELSLIRKLADILNETGLTEIELDHKGARVRVSKSIQASTMVSHHAPAAVHQVPAPVAMPAASPHVAVATPDVSGTPLKSPMVGTAYLASTPGAPAMAPVGSMVKEGQTVLIIEAMKTMNQIVAPKSGKVVRVNVENAQPVEFGEVLMVIE